MQNNIIKLVKNDYKRMRHLCKTSYLKKNYQKAIILMEHLASLMYSYNLIYSDPIVEELIREIGKNLCKGNKSHRRNQDNRVVFYDIVGMERRGLTLIYIKALVSLGYDVLYITYEGEHNQLESIQHLLEQKPDSNLYKLKPIRDRISCIHALYNAIIQYEPSKIFIHTRPNDIVANIVFTSCENQFTRYMINLTDHAFWIGTLSFDYLIEFREYGGRISNQKRHVDINKILLLPYYPVGTGNDFMGFPFEYENKKVIFSGGAFYKTMGSNDFFQIIRHILETHTDTIFLFAGSGNQTRFKKKLYQHCKEFEKRIFIINERNDLAEIMKHCYFYLSTYPILGGLMIQYAINAGKIPYTLTDGNFLNDGTQFVIHNHIPFCYQDLHTLLKELDTALADYSYLEKKEKKLAGMIISEHEFTEELNHIITQNKTSRKIKTEIILDKEFIDTQQLYHNTWLIQDYYRHFFSNTSIYIFLAFPFKFLIGGYWAVWERFKSITIKWFKPNLHKTVKK